MQERSHLQTKSKVFGKDQIYFGNNTSYAFFLICYKFQFMAVYCKLEDLEWRRWNKIPSFKYAILSL